MWSVSSIASTSAVSYTSTPSLWRIFRSLLIEWPIITIFRRVCGLQEISSWICKHVVMVVGRSICDTKNVSAKTHSLKSVTSQSRKSLKAWDVENCWVRIGLIATEGDAGHRRCRVSRVAMPNSLTSGTPALDLSSLDTSRSIDTKTTSEEGLKSLISGSPKNCSACGNPPSRAMLKSRFFFFRDAIKLPDLSLNNKMLCPKRTFQVKVILVEQVVFSNALNWCRGVLG